MPNDTFFDQATCDRCNARLFFGRTLSNFNSDVICIACLKDERDAPGYAAAVAAEQARVRMGQMNFVGVGLSDADREFLSARLAARKETKS